MPKNTEELFLPVAGVAFLLLLATALFLAFGWTFSTATLATLHDLAKFR